MEYSGKLYGKVSGEYFPLMETTEDVENLKKRIAELEAKNEQLRLGVVSGMLPLSEDKAEEMVFDIWKAGMDAEQVGMPSFDMAKDSDFIKEIIDRLSGNYR